MRINYLVQKSANHPHQNLKLCKDQILYNTFVCTTIIDKMKTGHCYYKGLNYRIWLTDPRFISTMHATKLMYMASTMKRTCIEYFIFVTRHRDQVRYTLITSVSFYS